MKRYSLTTVWTDSYLFCKFKYISAADGYSASHRFQGSQPGVVSAENKRIATWQMILFGPQGGHSAGKICFPWS